MGGFVGLGYAATIPLPKCDDAGFEMAASFFMAYEVWNNEGFVLAEKIILPVPDYVQLGASLYYMITCITNSNTHFAANIVFITKYVQAAVLPYTAYMTYINGPQHDPFLAAFAMVKAFFNIADSTIWYIYGNNIV